MSRLASIAKAGFYATPPVVTRLIASHLSTAAMPQRVVRLLDPCCGEGLAAEYVGECLAAETYGVEIEADRAAASRERLHHLIHGDGLGLKVTTGAWSLLYLNPPYDYDDESKRMEHAFLKDLTRVLCPEGILIFIIPKRRLATSARFLTNNYSLLAIKDFPAEEYEAFKQIVVFARRKRASSTDPKADAYLVRIAKGEEAIGVLKQATEPGISVPPLPVQPPPTFVPQVLDTEQMLAQLAKHGLWTRPEVRDLLDPPTTQRHRPLMPLKTGHIAALAAAGLLDDMDLTSPTGDRVLLKGRTVKGWKTVTDDDDEKVEKEVITTTLTLLNLRTGEFSTIGSQSKETPKETAAS